MLIDKRMKHIQAFAEIRGRPECQLCCLAAKGIFLKSTTNANSQDHIHYEACLRWKDPIWDKEVMKTRRPFFLRLRSDSTVTMSTL